MTQVFAPGTKTLRLAQRLCARVIAKPPSCRAHYSPKWCQSPERPKVCPRVPQASKIEPKWRPKYKNI